LFLDGGINFLSDFLKRSVALAIAKSDGLFIGSIADFLRRTLNFGNNMEIFVKGGTEVVAKA